MYNPLAQLQNWPKEPQLWDAEKRDRDNAEFNKPKVTTLAEDKESFLAIMRGWSENKKQDIEIVWPESLSLADEKQVHKEMFWIQEREEPQTFESVNEQVEIETKIDEAPNSPIIDWLVEQGILELDEWELVKEAMVNNSDIEKSLASVEWLDSEIKQKVIDTIKILSSLERKENWIKNFNKDFDKKIDWLKEVVEWWKNWEKELVWQNKKLIEKLWSNYFPIWDKESQKEWLNRTFKVSVNQLMDWKQFNKPDTFDEMLAKVKNPKLNFEDRFNQLKKIDKLINNDQSRANSRNAKAFQTREAWAEKQNQSLEKRFNEFKEQVKIVKNDWNKEKAELLLVEAQEIKEKADASGDIFVSTKLDIITNDLKDIVENT